MMSLCKLFPRLFSVCFVLGLAAAVTPAQQTPTRPRQVLSQAGAATTITETNGRKILENDLVVVSTAPEREDAEEAVDSFGAFATPAKMGEVERQMLAAIGERIGTPYRMGATGPNRYDCSGFVWSVFQEAGIDFERSSARSLWQWFAPAVEGEKFKFGTLVFFNNLNHVGIVADENGFFHASSSKGVVYSRFGEYWSKRITGFRRVPLAQPFVASAGR